MWFLARIWLFIRDGPLRLHGPKYHHFWNVIIPTSDGTTEIDHLIVSRFGIFVVELKDRSGWIFGSAAEAYWTAVHFGKRYRFQNPLRQNYGHLKAIEAFLCVDRRVIYSAVVFRGSFEFKTPIPDGVLCHSYRSWIASKNDLVLDDAAVETVLKALRTNAVLGWRVRHRHTQSIRNRYASDTTCPKCGGTLRVRMQMLGPQPGSQFLGCSRFPACRYTKSIP